MNKYSTTSVVLQNNFFGKSPRKGENGKEQIRHGHVYHEKVDSFSHGFHFVDKHSDK